MSSLPKPLHSPPAHRLRYVRHLSGEIAEEYNERLAATEDQGDKAQGENAKGEATELMPLIIEHMVPFFIEHLTTPPYYTPFPATRPTPP